MNYKLLLSTDNTSFTEIDLFPDQSLSYDAEFYDDKNVTDIKIPFYTDIKIPLTNGNIQFLGYNPISDDASLYPKEDYYYKVVIYNSSKTELAGIARVQAIEYNSDGPYAELELKDFLSLFLSNIKGIGIGDILTSASHTTRKTISNFFNTTANGGEAGAINVLPDTTRIVNFPFVDFCNDVQRFNYEIRQFTEYGSGFDRAGIVPTISVQQYLKQIGQYLSSSTLSVKVKSKLFAINETEAIPDFEAEKLQLLIPSRLLCKKDTNSREFLLSQHSFWSGTNEDLTGYKDLNNLDKHVATLYFGDKETSGNYNLTDDVSYQKYGVKNQSDKIEDYTDSPSLISTDDNLGWFSPHMSFKSRIVYKTHPTLDRYRPTGTIKLDIPVIDEDKLIYNIDPTQSNAKFNLCIGIHEDGYLKKKILLRNSDGTPIVLDASNATAVAGSSDKYTQTKPHFKRKAFDATNGNGTVESTVYFNANTHPVSGRLDALQWGSVDAYLPPLDETLLDIYGESRYSTNYFLEPVSGSLRVSYANSFEAVFGTFTLIWLVDGITSETVEASKIRKSISYIQGFSYFDLLLKANEDFVPYFPDDEYVIKDSLNNSTELSPIDLLKAIVKRFGCGLFYEFDGTDHIMRIDPLHIARTQGGELDIDDLKSIKISQPSDIIKNFSIKNKSYGSFYDEVSEDVVRGDTTREINPNGVSDLELELDSSVYYNAVTGEEFFEEENLNLKLGIVNKFEYGLTDNVFGTTNQIGVRFAYINAPAYSTAIKVPYTIEQSIRPNLTTETERIYRTMYSYPSYTEEDKHVFNGRLTHINSLGFNLLAEDESSLSTDYYDLIVSTEQVRSKGSVSIELSAVFSTENVSDISFMLEKKRLPLANNQNILIKSVSGEVYENYTYLDIKGLIE